MCNLKNNDIYYNYIWLNFILKGIAAVAYWILKYALSYSFQELI